VLAVFGVLAAGRAEGVDVTFTSSGQILDGDEWGNVYIYGDDTVVDMSGGNVDSMGAWDASTVNITGGYVSTLDARDSSTVDVSGGFVYGPTAFDSGTIVFSTSASGMALLARGNFGTVDMLGGTIDHVGAIESGTVNLYGGVISDRLFAWGSSTVNVFGDGLSKTSSGGVYGYGQVFGSWGDGSSFTIDLDMSETYSRINLVPEPSCVLLLGMGVLWLRRRRIGRR